MAPPLICDDPEGGREREGEGEGGGGGGGNRLKMVVAVIVKEHYFMVQERIVKRAYYTTGLHKEVAIALKRFCICP